MSGGIVSGVRYILAFLCFWALVYVTSAVGADIRSPGDIVVVVTPRGDARLCDKPNCDVGQHVARLPTNSAHTVISCQIIKQPVNDVAWYEIEFNDTKGWVSEFNLEDAPIGREVLGRRLSC